MQGGPWRVHELGLDRLRAACALGGGPWRVSMHAHAEVLKGSAPYIHDIVYIQFCIYTCACGAHGRLVLYACHI